VSIDCCSLRARCVERRGRFTSVFTFAALARLDPQTVWDELNALADGAQPPFCSVGNRTKRAITVIDGW
jgi:hypothetical protein